MTEIAAISLPASPMDTDAANTVPGVARARGIGRYGPPAVAVAAAAAGLGERFEAAVLSPLIAAILPPEDSSVWGGSGGKLWRGFYADEIGNAMAHAGGVGIADMIDAAVASRAAPAEAAPTTDNAKGDEG